MFSWLTKSILDVTLGCGCIHEGEYFPARQLQFIVEGIEWNVAKCSVPSLHTPARCAVAFKSLSLRHLLFK